MKMNQRTLKLLANFWASSLLVVGMQSIANEVAQVPDTKPATAAAIKSVTESGINWQDYLLTAKNTDDGKIAAKLGYLHVPVDHNQGNQVGSTMPLAIVKLPSTASAPKAPIVYLAGGPGGSGVSAAQGKRFALFAQLREISDVIIFEQRGTGLSRGALKNCEYQAKVPMHANYTRQTALQEINDAGKYCQTEWQNQGINLNHYTTMQSVADLEALRVSLGVKQLNLWGISYGTHLAMAMAKYYPDSINRMVLASSEGLDQTIKLPKYSDQHLARIAQAIKKDNNAAKRYPDLLGLMANVHQTYRQNPIVIDYQHKKMPQAIKLGISDVEIQLLTAYMLGRDREQIAMLPGAYAAMQAGDFSRLAPYFYYLKKNMWQFNPMATAMDGASGISQSRWAQVQSQSQNALLWRTHNLPYPDMPIAVDDLGDTFRADFSSDIPSLFIAGSLDGRTFIEEQQHNASQFTQSVFLTVNGAGHNLFMLSPMISKQISAFFNQQKVVDKTVNLTDIQFL